jgi:hypothetical protein
MLVSHPHFRRSVCALSGIIAIVLLTSATALAAPTVTVRVEGEASTLLAPTSVTLNAPEPVSGCAANSVAAAINDAAGGNWDHGEGFPGGDFTKTILGETHAFTHESDTWAEWVNYKWGGGICSDLLQEGDQVLMVADHEPEPFFAPTVLPLVVTEAPPSVQVGVPFAVAVSAVHTPAGAFAESGQGTLQPQEGATVSGAGSSATTGPTGVATLSLPNVGNVTLRATRPGDAPSTPFVVCVHNGNDGNCGTQAPGASPSQTAGSNSGVGSFVNRYTGPYALVAAVTGVSDGHVYARGRAPKLLSGSILAHNTVSSVSLELRRQYRRRCYAYDGVSEKFKVARCGAGRFFKVSSGGLYSYLLPEALRPGRYVLDIQATDVAGNRTTLARGTSRLVFYVR